jgi:azurin
MKIFSVVCACVLAIVTTASASQAAATKTATKTKKASASPAAAAQAKKAPAAPAKGAAGAARTITITGSETMKYDITEITAKPGEKLKVVLRAVGSMPKIAMGHNFVLLKPGVSALEVSNAAFNARATDFIPADMKDKILAHTSVAGGGETVEVTFTAPARPGKYEYICTFPGHFASGMKGTLTIK